MKNNETINVAVIGVGYMGALHALKYHSLADAKLVAVVDTRESRAKQVATQLACAPFTSVHEMLSSGLRIDAVTLAAPTAAHYSIASQLIESGIHCLVEKPFCENAKQAEALADVARQRAVILIPGYVERFNPAVQAVASDRPEVRYIKSYRVGPMSFRSIDIDVVKDILIHDLDLALYLSREDSVKVEVVRAISSPEGLNDIVNVHLKIGSSCYADLTASRLAIARRRKLRIFTTDGYYSIDCGRKTAVRLRRDDFYAGLPELRMHQEMGREPTAPEVFDAVKAKKLFEPGHNSQSSDSLRSELRHFLDLVSMPSGPSRITANDGVIVLRLAERIMECLSVRQYPDSLHTLDDHRKK